MNYMDGLDRISHAFQAARRADRAALIAYLTLGYPDPETSVRLVEAAASAGADLIELGIPFSDPLADGPTIQHSTQVALGQGITVRGCIDLAQELRDRGVTRPLLFMGYYNPILAYGVERFAGEAARAGVDGLIIPDLPPEEGASLEAACCRLRIALVYLAPPNVAPERLAMLAKRTSGFLYLVSVKGVTGARAGVPEALGEFVARARGAAHTPVAVGFGIATPEQAAAVGRLADGVIVGSAIIQAVEANPRDPVGGVTEFISGLAGALKQTRDRSIIR
jgi:tryptophan synthase alpha chain